MNERTSGKRAWVAVCLSGMVLGFADRALAAGPDVIYIGIGGISNYGSVGGIRGYALGSQTCNIGDQNLAWDYNGTPGLAMNAYRLWGGRLEQIGMSWVKHACCAAAGSGCGMPCNGQGGSVLGVGCLDVYSSGWNGGQSFLGKRSDINPFTGPIPPATGGSGNAIYKRLQIAETDLNQTPFGALYFVEGVYVGTDDAQNANWFNNASYQRVSVGGSFNLSLMGGTFTEGFPAIYAWQDQDPTVKIVNADVLGEGRFIVAGKASDNGDGTWRYTYAAFNLNSDRCGGSFSVPVPAGATVTNEGFHDVDYHSGEPATFNDDWVITIDATSVTWFSPETYDENPDTNALRWGTMYTFWFDADVEPDAEWVTVTVGLFKPGEPTTAAGELPGPRQEPLDCDGNGVPDNCDLDCGLPGGDCDVPDCGQADDCNGNGVLDECEGNLLPGITEQPASLTVCEGESASFSAGADGWEPLSYQWRLNGVDIPGGTSSVYAIDPVAPADAGDYDVVVTNVCGTVTSDPATLIIVVDADCDDTNPCTDDSCSAGSCGYVNNTAPCEDLDACTVNDVCAAGACEGTYRARPYGDVQPVPDPPATFPCSDPEERARMGDGFRTMLDVMCAFNAMNDGFPHTNCPCADVNPCGGDVFLTMLDVMSIFNTMNDPASAPCPDPCP